MNVYLNGNLAQVPAIHIDVLLTANLLWPQRCFTLYRNSSMCICFIRFYIIKLPHYDKVLVRIEAYYVTYLHMLHICVYKIYCIIVLL